MKTDKIIIQEKKGKIISLDFPGDAFSEVYQFKEGYFNTLIHGASIKDFEGVNIEKFPNSTNIDLMLDIIEDSLFHCYGINKDHDEVMIVFYLANLTNADHFGKWNTSAYLNAIEKKALEKDYSRVVTPLSFDGEEYMMAIGCMSDYKIIHEIFQDSKEKMFRLIREAEFELNEGRNEFNVLKINIPEPLKSSIRQYLYFFEDYVYQSKGKEIRLKINKTSEGLSISFDEIHINEIDTIGAWLNEYINFTKQNIDNFKVNFEIEIDTFRADILIADLRNQVSHLKNSLSIANLKNKKLGSLEVRNLNISDSISKDIPLLQNSFNLKIIELKNLIGDNKRKIAIEELKRFYLNSVDEYNELIVLTAKINKSESDIRMGVISSNELAQINSKINSAILELIDKLKIKKL